MLSGKYTTKVYPLPKGQLSLSRNCNIFQIYSYTQFCLFCTICHLYANEKKMLCRWNFNTNTFFFQQGRESLALNVFFHHALSSSFTSLNFLYFISQSFFYLPIPKRFCHVVNTNFSVNSRCWLPSACSCSSKWNIMMFHNLRGRGTDNSHAIFILFKVLNLCCTVENLPEL